METITDDHNKVHALPGPFKTIQEIKKANEEIGNFFFNPDTMRFFGTKLDGEIFEGRLFITEDTKAPKPMGHFRVRITSDQGEVNALSDIWHKTREDAEDEINEEIGGE